MLAFDVNTNTHIECEASVTESWELEDETASGCSLVMDHDKATSFHFERCIIPKYTTDQDPGALVLRQPSDLKGPGVFDGSQNAWRRVWFMDNGVSLTLVEDVPDEPLWDGEMTLWPAAVVLARSLERARWLRDIVEGGSVLELGAGAGLPSFVAAVAGARRSLCTEGGELAMAFLERNFELNTAVLHSPMLPGETRAQKLWWGDAEDQAAAVEWCGGDAPDIIMGSDIAYNVKLHEPLVATLLALMGPSTTMLISHDHNSTPKCGVAFGKFKQSLQSKGLWTTECVPPWREALEDRAATAAAARARKRRARGGVAEEGGDLAGTVAADQTSVSLLMARWSRAPLCREIERR